MIAALLFVLSLFATASVLAWLYILFQPARPWDFWPVGDDGEIPGLPEGQEYPPVAVLVPARNEAESLPRTLPALLQQDYPGDFHVFLIDDRSTDGTGEVARKIAAGLGKTERLTVIAGQALPEGWVGKVWALDQGARAANSARAEFFLLTDADILHQPQSLRRLVAESMAGKLALNSRMARLRCESSAEKLLIPAFVYFFNLLYPMRRANNPADSLAAAAGGCVLLSQEALEKLGGGFETIRSEIIDDVNLARQVKSRGLPIRLTLSRREVVSLREYPVLADVWKMVRRTAFTELKYSWLRLAGALCGLALIFIVPFVALLVGFVALLYGGDFWFLGAWAFFKGLIALALTRIVYGPAVQFFGLSRGWAWTLPTAGILYGAMTLDSALKHAGKRATGWR